MAIKESELTSVQSLSMADSVRLLTSRGESRNASMPLLAASVLEQYDLEVAGEPQSIVEAINSLFTVETYEIENTDLRTGRIYFYKQGKVVTFTSPNDFKQLTRNTFTTIGTLPEGWRPPREVYVDIANNVNNIRMRISVNGNIEAYSTFDITTNTNGAFSGAYIVN